jgi:hypothetical protein
VAEVSRHGTVLPTPDDPELRQWIGAWPDVYSTYGILYPRSFWLTIAERILRASYPQASSRDLNVTARSLAPFALAEPGRYT